MSKKHGIRLPGVMLDELKGQNYDDDDKRYQFTNVKKVQRNSKRKAPLSRKEQRRQERERKKTKRSGNNIKTSAISLNVESAKKDRQNGSRAVKPSLKREKVKLGIQVKPKQVRFSEFNEVKEISSDDELSSGDFDDFDEDDLNEDEWEQLRELEDSEEEQDDSGDDGEEEEEEPLTAEATMAKLKALKEKKRQLNSSRSEMAVDDAPNSSGDDEILYEGHSGDDIDEDAEDDDEESESGLEEMSAEETMAALKAMKERKLQAKSSKSSTTVIPEESSNKNKKESGKKEKSKSRTEIYSPLTPEDRAAIERDELDMKYYAGKLGLKNGKKLHATDEYDAIGGLLEGLDYFEDFGDDESGDQSVEDDSNVSGDSEDELISEDDEDEDEQTEEGQIENPFSSDDELSSGDFDEFDEDDLDENEWQQLRELEGHDSSSTRMKQKENIYAAPVTEENKSYVPPSLRKKQLEESDSENSKELKRNVKSSLNKLSDSNSAIIVTSLNELYDNYARQYVNDAINNQIIEVVAQKNKLLDTFILNYAGVAFSIWKLRGTEAGASFIQALVQKFLEIYSEQIQLARNPKSDDPMILSKETTNLLTLLGYAYNFGLVSSRLIYDIIKLLIQEPNEYTTELLLRIISVCGPLIRGDDPRALKNIIMELLANVKQMKQTPRLSFLLETLSDLKNNRLKPSVLAANHQTLKKGILGSLRISTSASSEPLLASLEDIKNVDSKGKWWLVGASWKGNQESAFDEANIKEDRTVDNQTNIKLDDDLLSEMIDWNEIAKQQRMNTDVRRAIFVSIMSAEDYLDAFAKIEKLNLKSKQSLDISRVLLHCLSNDGTSSGYNPYYSLLAGKLSEHNHKLLKSFQFLFWEIVKKFELETHSDDEEDTLFSNDDTVDEDTRLQRLAKQGRFFGNLIAEGHLKLDAFKHVPLMAGLNSDGIIFFDILLFQLFLSEGKAAEIKIKKDGKKAFEYNSDGLSSLIENGINIQNKNVILKALRWFISKHFDYSKYISGIIGSKEHDRESRRLSWAVAAFKKLIEEELKGAED